MPDTEKTMLALKGRVADMTAAWAAGSAESLGKEFFAEDCWLCGEGVPNASKGLAQIIEALTPLLSDSPRTTIEIVDGRSLGPAAALTWLHWTILDDTGMIALVMRSLTAWTEIDGKWRIAGDSFSVGEC